MLFRNLVRLGLLFIILLVGYFLVLIMPAFKTVQFLAVPLLTWLEALVSFFIFVVLLLGAKTIAGFGAEKYPQAPFLKDLLWNLSLLVILGLGYSAFLNLFTLVLKSGLWLYHLVFLLAILLPAIKLGWEIYRNFEALVDLIMRSLLPGGEKAGKSCPLCGHKNLPIAGYCEECGKKLPEKIAQCPGCSAAASPQSKYCLTCGEKFPRLK